MRRAFFFLVALSALAMTASCNEVTPINRVGVNVVEKSLFDGSWYLSRTVIDVDYEGAGIGTFPGDTAYDFYSDAGFSIPRIRWVIDEHFLYAFRDYEIISGIDGEPRQPGEDIGHPVAAFAIESHFDIKFDYSTTTGERRSVIVENATDRRWYERQFMRVDWSQNLLPSYVGQIFDLYEVLGFYTREPTSLYVQSLSDFPDSWRPTFDYMPCQGTEDTSEACTPEHRDHAGDYAPGQLYHMSFVTQELLSPGNVPDPFTGQPVNWCTSIYSDAPICTAHAAYVRNSFLRVSEAREYEPSNWVDTRFERAGYFRIEQDTYDRSLGALDPEYGYTDFKNYSVLRHNIWRDWVDDAGNAIPYADRPVRQVVWYTTTELPAHLVKPSIAIVGAWNETLMSTIRGLRGQADAAYPREACQTSHPDEYCFCTTDPETGADLLPDTDGDGVGDCAGRYDPFITTDAARAAGATDPYDCYVVVPDGAEPNMEDASVSSRLRDEDFNGWYGATFAGSECANVLRMNTCNRQTIADNGGTTDGMTCQERGDSRFKFLSYVDQPGTGFLGVATLRGNPVTGEIIAGDANIGGPALDSYRTVALQQYDLINGDVTEQELLTGEDVRSALESVNNVQLPAPPRIDFTVGNFIGSAAVQLEDHRADIDRHMAGVMARVENLQGEEGRRNIYSDRRLELAGSDIERRLLDNPETYLMAGLTQVPEGAEVTDHLLDDVSPFRGRTAIEFMQEAMETDRKLSTRNIHMPNEFTDEAVVNFVEQHRDWSRARLEFELNRMLFFETELHEMGHCMGLRHSFEASADLNNYYDDYYHLNRAFPLPDPATFDTDGTPGFSTDEQTAYEDAYTGSRELRERAGIDRWMNASTMEYTPNWYQRTVATAGKYDHFAIGYAYGDLVEVYDNSAGTSPAEVDPTNTPRRWMKFYNGGDVCTVDADCPYAPGGSHSAELLPINTEAGLTQTCVANPRGAALGNVCSSFWDDVAAVGERWLPVEYRYCTDERAAGLGSTVGTLGACNRMDEGDSYREIVRNVLESYERMYLWENFRRYRRNFNIGNYLFDRLIGRRLIILQNVYENLLFNYSSDPEFRDSTGPFGFYDQFLATADVLNFYARIMAQPNIGSYIWSPGWQRYRQTSSDPDLPGAQLRIPLGMGRYFNSTYQAGLSGIQRVERIGTFYDKLFVMQLMTLRGFGALYTADRGFAPFWSNMYDLFPLEMNQLFSGLIRNEPSDYAPRLECGGTFPNCDDARIVYMDFYRGDCSAGSDTCRPDPIDVTYRDLPVLDGGGSILLQIYAAIYGLSEFPVFFDTTFQQQLFVCVEGNGNCFAPSETSVEDVDYVRYTSRRYGKSFLAYQVEPTATVTNQTSIGYEMVREARDTDFILRMIQTYRGDFGGAPNSMANLTAEERNRLDALGYTIPGSTADVNAEEARLDGRVQDLESFFHQLIQLENEIGISGYL